MLPTPTPVPDTPEPGREGPNTTCEFGERTRTALAHCVGAGCCAAGTPLTQTRHMPAGGAYSGGTVAPRDPPRSPDAFASDGCCEPPIDGGSVWTRTAVACPSNAPTPLTDVPNAASATARAMPASRGPPADRTVNVLARDRIDHDTPKRMVRSTPVADGAVDCHTAIGLPTRRPDYIPPGTARNSISISYLRRHDARRDAGRAPHALHPNRFSTSPGFAWRPSFDFSKIGTPSRKTSKRPPFDGINVTSASGYLARISAAKLVARGL
jgi:hypothetical protein